MLEVQVREAVTEARQAAYAAAKEFFDTTLGGRDQYACGFASTRIYGIRGNTKVAKALAAAGLRKNTYEKAYELWNPSGLPCQNVDTLEAGARAAADVFRKYGFDAYSWSRLD